MSAQPFVAIELKRTHHVIGLLSRDADSGGGRDIAVLAGQALPVRAPVIDPVAAPAIPPFTLSVPAELLGTVAVTSRNDTEHRQVIGNPLGCIVAPNGSAAPTSPGAALPTLAFGAAGGGEVANFTVTIPSAAGADGVMFTVLIQEAVPSANTDPFVRITEGKVNAGFTNAPNVKIRDGAGDQAPERPLPAGTQVHVLLAVAGKPLSLKTMPTS